MKNQETITNYSESLRKIRLQSKETAEIFKNVPNSELEEYVWNWYGTGNDSWEFFTNNPITVDEVIEACHTYTSIVCPVLFQNRGYCDSIDREMVRDVLFIQKGMRTPSEVEYGRGMKRIFTPKGKTKLSALRTAVAYFEK